VHQITFQFKQCMLTFGLELFKSFFFAFRQSSFCSIEVDLGKNGNQASGPTKSRVSKSSRIWQRNPLFMKLNHPLQRFWKLGLHFVIDPIDYVDKRQPLPFGVEFGFHRRVYSSI
jgi:hypothetical protein